MELGPRCVIEFGQRQINLVRCATQRLVGMFFKTEQYTTDSIVEDAVEVLEKADAIVQSYQIGDGVARPGSDQTASD